MLKKILILEDDPDTLFMCEVICAELGLEIVSSITTDDVVGQIRSAMPDIVLLDNQIPGPGGLESLRLIRQEEDMKDLPIIFFSAGWNVQLTPNAALADYFLSKPFNISDLETAIRQLLDKSA